MRLEQGPHTTPHQIVIIGNQDANRFHRPSGTNRALGAASPNQILRKQPITLSLYIST
jgi:hypothetical protein